MHNQKNSLLTFMCFYSVCALVMALPTLSGQARDDGQKIPHADGQSSHQGLGKGKFRKEPSETSPVLWPPVDVDAAVPAVAPEIACPLEEVLSAARQRVEELVANLDRFTATETIDSVEIDKNGHPGHSSTYSFNYVAAVSSNHSGDLQFDESRTAVGRNNPNRNPINTVGLALGAAVFHPRNIDDFDIACEGLGQWHGAPAWQLHFQERSGRPSKFQAVYADGTWYDVKLKGRAWIRAETCQIEQMEFDLVRPIPRIRLITEHMSVEYNAVDFAARDVELWLPKSVDLYIDVGGHRYLNRHRLANYLLFSVETEQEFQLPRELK